jgi:hypothetical protein
MGYAIAALCGAALGAAAALLAALYLLQKLADRDLIERRMRALLQYRESLGDPERQLAGNGAAAPAAAEQFLRNIDELAREVRLTAWLFDDPLRAEIGRAVDDLERAARRCRGGAPPGGAPALMPVIAASCRLDSELRAAAARTLREHRRFRFLPRLRAGESGEPGAPHAVPFRTAPASSRNGEV